MKEPNQLKIASTSSSPPTQNSTSATAHTNSSVPSPFALSPHGLLLSDLPAQKGSLNAQQTFPFDVDDEQAAHLGTFQQAQRAYFRHIPLHPGLIIKAAERMHLQPRLLPHGHPETGGGKEVNKTHGRWRITVRDAQDLRPPMSIYPTVDYRHAKHAGIGITIVARGARKTRMDMIPLLREMQALHHQVAYVKRAVRLADDTLGAWWLYSTAAKQLPDRVEVSPDE